MIILLKAFSWKFKRCARNVIEYVAKGFEVPNIYFQCLFYVVGFLYSTYVVVCLMLTAFGFAYFQ